MNNSLLYLVSRYQLGASRLFDSDLPVCDPREIGGGPGTERHQFCSCVVDMVSGKEIYKTDWRNDFEYAASLAVEFLNEYYPEHRDPFAYWPD